MKTSFTPAVIMAIAASLGLSSCIVPGPVPVGPVPLAPAPVVYTGFGCWDTVPIGYVGETYFINGRHYYGGHHETGRFIFEGRRYTSRYVVNGRAYYGGRLIHHRR